MKRVFDFSVALLAIAAFLPVFLIISLLITLDSAGGSFYKQRRVGKNKVDFKLYRFRTMYYRPIKNFRLNAGARNSHITKFGYWLRKYKLDELPQLVNILKGEMSFVGPRPEIKRHVSYYNPDQQRVLSVKPGITDLAFIMCDSETKALNAETYVKEILPAKISHNLKYVDKNDLWIDLKIIFLSLAKISRLKPRL